MLLRMILVHVFDKYMRTVFLLGMLQVVISLVDIAKKFSKQIAIIFVLAEVFESFNYSTSLATLFKSRFFLLCFYNFIHSDGCTATTLWDIVRDTVFYEYFYIFFNSKSFLNKENLYNYILYNYIIL